MAAIHLTSGLQRASTICPPWELDRGCSYGAEGSVVGGSIPMTVAFDRIEYCTQPPGPHYVWEM